jgi:hypothetical protein
MIAGAGAAMAVAAKAAARLTTKKRKIRKNCIF